MSRRVRAIALVDDEPVILHLLEKALRRRGDQVRGAHSFAEGRALLIQSGDAFDCAIIDLTLPDGDGLSLAVEVHAMYPALPIILTTGGVDPVSTEFGVLLKPFTFEDLWAAIA